MELTSPIDVTTPFIRESEEDFHSVTDYLQWSNRRKTVWLTAQGLVNLALVAAVIYLAIQGRPTYVVMTAANGEEYIVSTPKKKLDLRDMIIYNQVKQDLTEFSESYFERSSITAQRDYEKARWFLPNELLTAYDAAALGDRGWVAGLMTHALAESRVYINTVEIRDADLVHEPYFARVYLTRTGPAGQRQSTIATLTFVVRPKLTEGWSRIPLYNALGVFIVQPPKEIPDFRQ